MFNQKSIILILTALVGLGCGAAALAGPAWVEQGPGPILNGGEEGMSGPNAVAGAINAIVPDPTSADILFVGAVSGGVWKTSNATAATPTWTPLTDQQLPELPINSLAMSPVYSNTLFAGTGSTTSFNRFGTLGIGVARSTDGGATWTVLAGSTFTGRAINSIVPTTLGGGNTVLAATWLDQGGVWRSTDNGVTFVRISGNGTSNLPNAGVSKLIADPSTANRFYAGVPGGAGGGAQAGVYRSDDGGVTWMAVNNGLAGLSTSLRILLSVHNDASNNVVYADVIASNGTLSGVFRSTNQGGSWTSLGLPPINIYPGAQGFFHGAIAADPSDPNVVFISGDRQDSPFPNANGCNAFSGTLFRWAGTWESTEAVCNGANHTSPHADSRFITFDANGSLLQTNDGGIVRLVTPNTSATRRWIPVDGNLRSAEFHSVAYDPLSNVTFGGLQDNGTAYQTTPGGFTGNELLGGDGAVVGLDADQVAHPGTSIRYSSFQSLQFFNRTTWTAANTRGGFTQVGLNITSGPGAGLTLFQFDPNIQFYNPFTINAITPTRMLIGTANIYESMNQGDSLANLDFTGFFIGSQAGWGRPMAYGSRLSGTPNPDVFYVGAGSQLLHRVILGGPITTLSAYPGSTIITVAMNPQNYRQVFVVDSNSRVWGSFDEGASWIELTANLPSLTGLVTTVEVFSPDATIRNTVLIAGGFGAFQMRRPGAAGGSWTLLSSAIPNALVLDLHYDYTNNVLVAGTLGRGSWTLSSFFRGGGGTGAAVASSSAVVSPMAISPPIPSPPAGLPAPPPAANPDAP
jgi:hypothetical protein